MNNFNNVIIHSFITQLIIYECSFGVAGNFHSGTMSPGLTSVASFGAVTEGDLTDADTDLEETAGMANASGCKVGDTEAADEGWDFAEYLFGHGSNEYGTDRLHYEKENGVHGYEDDMDVPAEEFVFPGCPLKLDMSVVPIVMFILRNKLSLKVGQDLIELLTAHFPDGHKAMTSLYRLKSYWRKKC